MRIPGSTNQGGVSLAERTVQALDDGSDLSVRLEALAVDVRKVLNDVVNLNERVRRLEHRLDGAMNLLNQVTLRS